MNYYAWITTLPSAPGFAAPDPSAGAETPPEEICENDDDPEGEHEYVNTETDNNIESNTK